MSSLSNIEEHLEEPVCPHPCIKYIRNKIPIQPVKKQRVDNSEETRENAKPNEVNLQKTMETDKNKGFSCQIRSE
jgi:hypothetical protein